MAAYQASLWIDLAGRANRLLSIQFVDPVTKANVSTPRLTTEDDEQGNGFYLVDLTVPQTGRLAYQVREQGISTLLSGGVVDAAELDAYNVLQHGDGYWNFGHGAATPGYCKIYGIEQDSAGEPVDDRTVSYEIINPPQMTSTGIVEGGRKETSSNGDGVWVIRKALIGVQMRIIILEAGLDETLTVPNQAELNLRDYLASL